MEDVNYTPLPVPYNRKAEEELEETEETARNCILELRKLIADDEKLHCPQTEDYLLRFLRVRKFIVTDAFNSIKSLCQTYSKWPSIYKSFDYSTIIEQVFQSGFLTVLPDRDPEGAPIVCAQLKHWNPPSCTHENIYSGFVTLCEFLLSDPVVQVCGIVILVDGEGFGFRHLTSGSLADIFRCSAMIKHGTTIRYKGFHFCHQNRFMKFTFPIFVNFLPKKLQERIHFYGSDLSKLHEKLYPDILPVEFGGTKIITNDQIINQLLELKESIVDTVSSIGYD